MKTLHLLALLLITFATPRAESASLEAPSDYPGGIAEVEWGMEPAVAQETMSKRAGVKLVSKAAGKLTFAGGTFAEQSVERWELLFVDGKFREAKLRLKPEEPLRQYEALRKLISTKYRKAGREERENSIHRATYWEYKGTMGKFGIVCDTNTGGITLVYKFTPATPAALQPKPKDI
jgi:hypothetical protein